jgi:hypothetical protein
MMPTARFVTLSNETLWNNITKNIINVFENKNFKANAFILTDVVMAYANYYLYLAEQTVQGGKQFENNLYLGNFQKFWKLIEGHILTINEKEFEIPYPKLI